MVLIIVSMFALSPGCTADPDLLTPDQVDESMVDHIVKVKGKITYAVESPMGMGGMYMKIGNSKGEVDVRIQPELWDNYSDSEKSLYREGKTVIVEGVLFKAGLDLVVVHGKYEPLSDTTTTSNTSQ